MSAVNELARELRKRLVEEARYSPHSFGGDRAAIKDRIVSLVEEQAGPLAPDQRRELIERILSSTLGLERLEPLIDDPTIDEIMVNGLGAVMVERGGRMEQTEIAFESERELMHVIERVLSPLGRRVDEASPLVDARLSDGSRINCVIRPLSLDGPILTIRRFRRRGFTVDELVESGSLTSDLRHFLANCVSARLNVVVSGGTGSGKTTFLNVLSSLIEGEQRIITIEDAAELRLRQPHVIRLESRPANLEGQGEVTIRALVRNALRMRPDRIIVGEVRGAEALDMLQALNTGHDGSMTTVHANSAADALRRIETLALMADVALPHIAVREQIASALDLVVHVERARDGLRRVVAVAEVVRVASEVGVRELYSFRGGEARLLAPPTDALATRLSVIDEVLLLTAVAGALAAPVVLSVGETATVVLIGRLRPLVREARLLIDRVLGPLRLAGVQGKVPTDKERFGSLAAAAAIGLVLGFAVAGLLAATASSIACAWFASRAFVWRRERYRRRLDAGAAAAALALADALGADQSVRGALTTGGSSLSGPIAIELRQVARELELGAETEDALDRLRTRTGSRRINLIVAAVRIQRRAGGSLATLLREIAATISDHDRLEDEARAASAQARFTSVVVLCLPLFGLILAELVAPGIVGRMAGSAVGVWLLALALLLQLAGVFTISRLSRVDG